MGQERLNALREELGIKKEQPSLSQQSSIPTSTSTTITTSKPKSRLDSLREEANKKAEVKIAVPTVPTPAPYIPPPQKIAVEDGISRTEQVWKFDINDASIIPREYLIIDERAIKHSIKAGIRSIPGVKIYSEQVKKYRVK